MGGRRTSTSLLLLVVLATVGWALVALPPTLLEWYRRAAELSPLWRRFYLASVSLGAALLGLLAVRIVLQIWRNTRRKQAHRRRRDANPSQLSRAEKEQEINDNLQATEQLTDDTSIASELRGELRRRVAELVAKRESQTLEMVAFGTVSSGKSALLCALAGRDVFRSEAAGGTTLARSDIPWPGADRVVLVDTPGLAEVGGEQRAQEAAEVARSADLVLFVVDGPLKAYELELLRALGKMEQRTLVCLNKQDWFGQQELDDLVAQIVQQAAPIVAREDVVPVCARPVPRRRVRVLADGSEVEERVDEPTDISGLAKRMLAIVARDGRDLLLANLLLRSRGMVDSARQKVLAALDRSADQIVYKAMWAAGGAVAVNPIPLLDLAGGSALTVKMVLDLAHVYRQEIDADTVVTLLAQLGKNLIALVGATAAAPAIGVALGALLKTVPGIGTIAGGLVQGLVQALVTQWIGKVFIVYFRAGMQTRGAGFVELARDQWREVTRPEQLRRLIQAGRRELAEGWRVEGRESRVEGGEPEDGERGA